MDWLKKRQTDQGNRAETLKTYVIKVVLQVTGKDGLFNNEININGYASGIYKVGLLLQNEKLFPDEQLNINRTPNKHNKIHSSCCFPSQKTPVQERKGLSYRLCSLRRNGPPLCAACEAVPTSSQVPLPSRRPFTCLLLFMGQKAAPYSKLIGRTVEFTPHAFSYCLL